MGHESNGTSYVPNQIGFALTAVSTHL